MCGVTKLQKKWGGNDVLNFAILINIKYLKVFLVQFMS